MSLSATVGQLVTQRPSRARVFEQFGIDYCCGGNLPLEAACTKKGVDLQQVLAALDQEAAQPAANTRNWANASITEITEHVETTHHAYLKRELPRLEYLTGRVASRHGGSRAELPALHQLFLKFKAELEAHMMKEERVLFPMCRRLEIPAPASASPCGSVKGPVEVMISEHDHAGDDLSQMRRLTNDFVPPEGACNTYRAMLAGLADLEADMHQHVHLENNVLFPRAIAKESHHSACSA